MAYVITDRELEQICKSSPDCEHKCSNCDAFAANQHYRQERDWDDDDDEKC